MKITVYLKNGAFVKNDFDEESWNMTLANIHRWETIHLTNPMTIIRTSEITHIIAETPNQTENI